MHTLLKTALGGAIFALIVLSIMLFQQYQRIRHLGYIAAHRQSILRSLHGAGTLTPADAGTTQSWMTFDYVNHIFSLPPQYLQTKLSITDPKYPRLTISAYSMESTAIPQSQVLMAVQNAISAYSGANK